LSGTGMKTFTKEELIAELKLFQLLYEEAKEII
jgi:hypothetical protein